MNFDAPFPFYLYQETFLATQLEQPAEMKPDRSASTNKRVASKVAPRLYLTCLATAEDVKELKQLGITHVVSAIEDAPKFPSTYPLRTLHISVSDHDREDILSHLPATTSFIRGALAESTTNRVMVRTDCTPHYRLCNDDEGLFFFFLIWKQVHCFMGISRSTTVVLAYLVATTQMTPREALVAVRSKRAIVRPNRGFMSQLEAYYSTSSHTLQARLAEEVRGEGSDDSKRAPGSEKTRCRGRAAASSGVTWSLSAKDAAMNYVRSAFTAATPFPSFIPQQCGGKENWELEKRIS